MARTADSAQEQDVLKISVMASFEKNPTKQNLLSVLQKDSLHRNDALRDFLRFLDRIDYPCAVALDGRWGSGKTFFVKEAQMILNAENPRIRQKGDDLQLPFSVNMQQRFLPVYYDAWRNDNAIDPLLSLIYTIASNEHVKQEDYFQKPSSLKTKLIAIMGSCGGSLLGSVLGAKIGAVTGDPAAALEGAASGAQVGTSIESLFKCMEALKKSEDPLNDTKEEKDLEQEIRSFLQGCKNGIADRIVIFIDELDRCRPTFAVQLLERIKHFFQNENVTFVLAINSVELIHTIRAVYGQDFDANRYLDRFFDFRVGLPQADIRLYLKQMQFIDAEKTQAIYAEEILYPLAEQYELSLREIEKLCRALRTIGGYQVKREHYFIQKGLDYNKLISPSAVFDPVKLFCYYVILPVALVLKMTDSGQYDAFISGRDAKPLTKLFDQPSDIAHEYIVNTFRDEWKVFGVSIQTATDLESVYQQVFGNNSAYMDAFLGMVNLLSPFASYHV